MNKEKIVNKNRFFFFNENNKYYCFDDISHKIFFLDKKLFSLLQENKITEIRREYRKFYKTVILRKRTNFRNRKNENCYVTINFSTNCNLNCKYCFRNKKDSTTLSTTELKDIIEYVKKYYFPKAKKYVFSLCYTSESSLEIEKLKYFDFLIGQYENYLFNRKQISNIKAIHIYKELPTPLKIKYSLNNNPIEVLNKIITCENLWEYFDISKVNFNYENNDALQKNFKDKIQFSFARKIMINRIILNTFFSHLSIQKEASNIFMSFMTNGTNVTDDFVNFIRSILLKEIYVSIDGSEIVHNSNRIYVNKNGTYDDTIKGIKKLQKNGISVNASVVITPDFPDLFCIIDSLESLGFSKISFNLARGKEFLFSKESINYLLESIRRLFDLFIHEIQQNKISTKLILIKNSILFNAIKLIYYNRYVTSRCTWGNELIIDNHGDLYHCNTTIGIENDKLGHFTEHKSIKKLLKKDDKPQKKECKNCYARYLCGGTCYAEILLGNNNNENCECYFHKELINENIKFFVKLKNMSLLDKFMQIIN